MAYRNRNREVGRSERRWRMRTTQSRTFRPSPARSRTVSLGLSDRLLLVDRLRLPGPTHSSYLVILRMKTLVNPLSAQRLLTVRSCLLHLLHLRLSFRRSSIMQRLQLLRLHHSTLRKRILVDRRTSTLAIRMVAIGTTSTRNCTTTITGRTFCVDPIYRRVWRLVASDRTVHQHMLYSIFSFYT